MHTVWQGEDLLFLISQPRAGSTMLQRILAGHPDVHTTAEPWLMLHPVYALKDEGHGAEYNAGIAFRALQDFLSTLEGGKEQYYEALRRMARHLYSSASQQAGKPLFLDKTPRYYWIIDELAHLFPGARFIILLRNPLAVLSSIISTWAQGDWIRLSQYYHDLLVAPGLLLEGIQMLGDRVQVVHYEALVSEPDEQISQLCNRLDLSYSVDMLEYGRKPTPPGRYGDSVGVQQHTRPEDTSLDRWLELGRSKQTRHFAQEYLAALGPALMAEMGYDYDELQARLNAIPCTNGGPIVSWKRVFSLENTFRGKLSMIITEFLQQRNISQFSKRLVKLLMGRL